jgi:hypothetical protein
MILEFLWNFRVMGKMAYFIRNKLIFFLIIIIWLVVLLNGAVPSTQDHKILSTRTEKKDSSASKQGSSIVNSPLDEEAPLIPPTMEIKLRSPGENKLKRVVSNHAFAVGERLEFSVGYGMIKAGTAVMEIPDMVKLDGKKCYHIISTAESNKFFSVFFKVDDRVESFMEAHGLYSLRYDKHLREGKFKSDMSMTFDQENHLALYNNGKDTFQVPEYVQDVLSAFYFVRTQNLEIGKSILVDNHTDKKTYPLEVRVLRKEKVKVPAGEFNCVVVEPMLKTPGIFEQKGSLTVWLTDDEVKMPVLMKSKVIIGSISTELVSYKLGEVGKY